MADYPRRRQSVACLLLRDCQAHGCNVRGRRPLQSSIKSVLLLVTWLLIAQSSAVAHDPGSGSYLGALTLSDYAPAEFSDPQSVLSSASGGSQTGAIRPVDNSTAAVVSDGTTEQRFVSSASAEMLNTSSFTGYNFAVIDQSNSPDEFQSFEVTAAPEPSTIFSAVFAWAAIGWHQRRRLQALIRASG